MKRNKFNRVEIVDLETGNTIQYLAASAREVLKSQAKLEKPRYVLKDEVDRAQMKEDLKKTAERASAEAIAKAKREAAAAKAVAGKASPEEMEAVKNAVATILADADDGDPRLTKDGNVQVSAIAELTGFEVTAAMRNAAIEDLAED